MTMTAQPQRRRDAARELACAGLLLLPLLVLLAPYLFAGRAPLPDYLAWYGPWRDCGTPRTAWNPLWYDALGQYWPWRTVLHAGLRANQLPLWSPWQFRGYPFAANGQSALFYPLNWLLFGVGSVTAGFRLGALAHLWLAGWGAYRLGRELGQRRVAALTAGVSFELCGFLVCWLPLPTLVASSAWLPLALALVERTRRTGDLRAAVGSGVCLGLSALAGHPQMFYYAAVTTGVLGVVRLLPRRSADSGSAGVSPAVDMIRRRCGRDARAPRAPALLVVCVCAGLVSAPTMLPAIELAPHGHRAAPRSAAAYQGFLGRSIGVERLVTLLLPRFYGSPERGTVNPAGSAQEVHDLAAAGGYWGVDPHGAIAGGDFSEFNLFAGVAALLLALLGWWAGGPVRWYAAAGLVALVLALGTPLNAPLYWYLPGYSAGAGPCRLVVIWCLAVAVGAGAGVQAALASRVRAWPCAGGLVGALVAMWLLAAAKLSALGPLFDASQLRRLEQGCLAVVVLALTAALAERAPRWLPALVALELLAFGTGFNPTCPVGWLRGEALATGDWTLIKDAPERWGFYRAPSGLTLPPNLATVAGLRDCGGYDSLALAGTREQLAKLAAGRPTSPAINGNMLLLGHLESEPPGVSVVLDSAGRHACRGGPRTDGTVELDQPNRVALRVSAGPRTLVDSAYPGWRLYGPRGEPWAWRGEYGGERNFTAPADGLVRWVFAPTSVRLGLFCLCLGCALTAALLTCECGGNKR